MYGLVATRGERPHVVEICSNLNEAVHAIEQHTKERLTELGICKDAAEADKMWDNAVTGSESLSVSDLDTTIYGDGFEETCYICELSELPKQYILVETINRETDVTRFSTFKEAQDAMMEAMLDTRCIVNVDSLHEHWGEADYENDNDGSPFGFSADRAWLNASDTDCDWYIDAP